MRMAIVCSYYPWPPSVGGVETIVRNIAIELAKRGHEVHVITTPFDVTTMKQVSNYGVEERDGVVIHKLRPGRIRIVYARTLKGLRETVERIKPDVVHTHNLHPHLFQLARWKKDIGYKLYAELHHPAATIHSPIQKMAMPFAIMWLKRAQNNIDVFIAHTQLEKEWLISIGIPSNRITIVRFPAIPSNLLNYEASSIILYDIAYLGRIVPYKGLHVLLKALSIVKKEIDNIKTSIAGPADPRYLSKLRSLAKKLGLEENVSFLEPIYGEKRYEFIKTHKIFVLPSLREYTPNVLLEAQALGVPVVATRVSAIPEIVVNGETGVLVDPNDPYELAKAIALLIENEELWKRMSLRAREWAKNFTLEKRVDELEKLYRTILHG